VANGSAFHISRQGAKHAKKFSFFFMESIDSAGNSILHQGLAAIQKVSEKPSVRPFGPLSFLYHPLAYFASWREKWVSFLYPQILLRSHISAQPLVARCEMRARRAGAIARR
jgi:hypothetical protein